MTSYDGIKFPPRAELPPGITIVKLPGVGRTWYARGFAYWSRRIGGIFLLAGAATMYILILGGAVLAVARPWSPGFLAAVSAEIVFSLISGVFAFRHLWQAAISKPAVPANPRITIPGVGAVYAGFLVGGLGALLLGVAMLLTAGFVLAALAIWLVPVPPAERRARRLLAEELAYYQHHGHSPGMRGGHKR
jgi:hypothetical protein